MSNHHTTITLNDDLARRRAWFEDYFAGVMHNIDAELARQYVCCPCCGFPTLPERGGDDICELCNWQDDGQDDPHADEVWGGPNGSYSLTLARENFSRFGMMYCPENGARVMHHDTVAEWAAKQGLIRVFEMLRSGVGDAGGGLQAEMASCRRILHAETIKKLRGYERALQADGTD